jgi:hypothetical protein
MEEIMFILFCYPALLILIIFIGVIPIQSGYNISLLTFYLSVEAIQANLIFTISLIKNNLRTIC